ncbi:MAG: GAF domain-containing protein, partial [Deltaproteobacteria bacterium]
MEVIAVPSQGKPAGGQLRKIVAEPERKLEKAEQRCAAMIEVGRSLTAIADIDKLLQLMAERITELMEADRSTIFLLDREKNELWSKVAQGEGLAEIRFPADRGVAGWVAHNGRTLNLRDAYADERFNPEIDRETGYRTSSLLSVPLRGKSGQVLGVVQCLNKKQGHFSPDDERLLEAICSQVSMAIENAQLVLGLMARNIELVEVQEDLARRVRELDVLFAIEKSIASALHIDQMLERLLQQAVELLGCDAASIV